MEGEWAKEVWFDMKVLALVRCELMPDWIKSLNPNLPPQPNRTPRVFYVAIHVDNDGRGGWSYMGPDGQTRTNQYGRCEGRSGRDLIDYLSHEAWLDVSPRHGLIRRWDELELVSSHHHPTPPDHGSS